MEPKSRSKAAGASSAEAEKPPSVMPSSNGELPSNTLDTSENSPELSSRIGFQPTKPLGVDEDNTNAKLVVAFVDKLGTLVIWKRLELADGQVVIALCFPMDKWDVSSANELVAIPKQVTR